MKVKKRAQLSKPRRPYKDAKGKFAPGNPGKPVGAVCKPFTSLKQAFLDAFNDPRVGGVEGLVMWIIHSEFNKRYFYSWITKMLPRTVDVQGVDPVTPTNLNGLKEEELDAVLIGVGQAIQQKKVSQ